MDGPPGRSSKDTWSRVYKRGGGHIEVLDDVRDEDIQDVLDDQDCLKTGCYQVYI